MASVEVIHQRLRKLAAPALDRRQLLRSCGETPEEGSNVATGAFHPLGVGMGMADGHPRLATMARQSSRRIQQQRAASSPFGVLAGSARRRNRLHQL